MGREPELIAMEAPVGDFPSEHCSARTLPSLGVRARAQDRIAIDHRRGLHPRAVLALLRNVACEVGRTRLQNPRTSGSGCSLAALTHSQSLVALAESLPTLC